MDFWIPIIYDAAVVLIVVVCIIKGSKDGFAKTFIQSIGFAVALITALTVGRLGAEFTYTTAIKPFLMNSIESSVDNAVNTEDVVSGIEEAIDKLPAVSNLLFDFSSFEEKLSDTVFINSEEIASAIEETVLKPVIEPLLEMVIFIVVFIVLLIVVTALAKGSKKVNEVPVIGGVNAFFGGVFGTVYGVVLLALAAGIISIIISTKGDTKYVSESIIERTYLFRFVFNIITGKTKLI